MTKKENIYPLLFAIIANLTSIFFCIMVVVLSFKALIQERGIVHFSYIGILLIIAILLHILGNVLRKKGGSKKKND